MFGLFRHPVSHYGQHANYAPVTSHPDFAVFPHETVCKPSSLLPELRSIRTRLSQLQTMIYGQEHRRALDNIQKTNSSRLDTEHLHTTDGILAAGRRRNLEPSYTANQHECVHQLCQMCSSRTLCAQTQCSNEICLDPVVRISAGGPETNVTSERDNDFTPKAVRDMIAQVYARKPRTKKAPPQPTIVYNTVYNSGATSSATISSGTPVHSISTPPSPRPSPEARRWRLLVVSIL